MYMAISMLLNFVVFLLVNVVELIAWIIYLTGGYEFYGWYASVIGLWGSIVLYLLPPIFSAYHIATELGGKITQQPGAYCVFQIVIGLAMWLLNSFLHIFYSERLRAQCAEL